MILLRKQRLLFIKGAKVAGTSIEVFLAGLAGEDDIVTPISPPSPGHRPRNYAGPDGSPRFYNHIDAWTVRGMLGAEYFDSLRRFGVVREPFGKVLSTFAMQYVLNGGDYSLDRAIDDTWSEAEKYCAPDGTCILTDVLRYERLDDELRTLFGEAGIRFDRLRVSEKTGYKALCPVRPEFSTAQRERVRRKFEWEFRNFYDVRPDSPADAPSGKRTAAVGAIHGEVGMKSEKEGLVEWHGSAENLSLQNLDSWYLGGTVHTVPKKAAFRIDSILEGWVPHEPPISESSRVIGVGSCFARYFILWLAENGFNRNPDSSPYNALMRYGATFESPAVIAQQFRWAFDEFDSREALWIGKDKEIFEASEERKRIVRETLQRTDVLIVTLGLSEVWYDRMSGEPLWRALTRRHYDPARHVFRVESIANTKRMLEKIEDIRSRHLSAMKIVYTVSPVRMTATFRPVSAITANSASKAILRAALDEFLREHEALVNRQLFYFPSYEIVHDYFRDPFEEDNRHVTSFVAANVVRTFASRYCSAAMLERLARPAPTGSTKLDTFLDFSGSPSRDVREDEYRQRICDLERQVEDLQRTCDERMKVIGELDHAAKERLALVERLHGECEQLQQRLSRGRRPL